MQYIRLDPSPIENSQAAARTSRAASRLQRSELACWRVSGQAQRECRGWAGVSFCETTRETFDQHFEKIV